MKKYVFFSLVFFLLVVNLFFVFKLSSSPSSIQKFDEDICLVDDKILVQAFTTPHCPFAQDLMPKVYPFLEDLYNEEKIHLEIWDYDIQKGKNSSYYNDSENLTKIFLQGEIGEWDNLLTDKNEKIIPQEVFDKYLKYNPRKTTPTILVGCRYAKIGVQDSEDIDKEVEEFKDLLTNLVS